MQALPSRALPACLALAFTLGAAACSDDADESHGVNSDDGGGIGGTGLPIGGTGGTPPIIVQGGTGATSGGNAGSGGMIVTTLPPDFTASNDGGYKLGEPVDPSMPNPPMNAGGCNNLLTGIVRDFRGLPDGHPNFQMDIDQYGVYPGMVTDMLGSNQKPVFSGMVTSEVATNATDFDQWYLTTDGVNQPYFLTVFLEPAANGIFTFHSDSFFPLDGTGFGDMNEGSGGQHNFFFTFELHTTFQYRGGETFTFIGDDDVWVFINQRLAVDIGGVHGQTTASVNLDNEASRLGITAGQTYALDMFHAERHTSESNFRIDTSLAFNCSVFVPDVPR
ncbi:MAG TPA: fibro-slime domain-containing protein [Polyangiaceae bacterium]